MFWTRTISGIVLVIIALATILTGGPVLIATLLICSMIGMQEVYGALEIVEGNEAQVRSSTPLEKESASKPQGKWNPLSLAGLAGAVIYYLVLFLAPGQYYLVSIVGTVLLILVVYVATFPRFVAEQVVSAVFGFLYVAVMLGFIYLIRCEENGKILVWLVFLSSWGADTCAYLAGRAFGRHKMAPVLSPKKSVEGAVGGILGAGLLGFLYALYFKMPAAGCFVTCAAGAVISIFGDLAASAIKRDKGIKDYGKLIPGHGGILDRFDSVIFTAPVIYALTLLLMAAR